MVSLPGSVAAEALTRLAAGVEGWVPDLVGWDLLLPKQALALVLCLLELWELSPLALVGQ